MMRRRLVGPDAQIDFPVLEEVRATGATDYLALPLCSVEGVTSAVTYATDRPEGFISAEVSMLESLSPALAMAIEIQAKRRILTTLLDIYLGHDAGLRVLAGTIRRGDMQRIYAVLWYCDLRGFTRLSEKLPPDELIETLNAFFECMGGAVEAESGDILKFIGDGMLAIFPVGEFEYCDNVATIALPRMRCGGSMRSTPNAGGPGSRASNAASFCMWATSSSAISGRHADSTSR
jgi:adenylate cyclase